MKLNLIIKKKLEKKIIIKICDTKIEKQRFHHHKRSTSIRNIGINKIVVFNKFCFGKKGLKYFTGYKYAENIRLLCMFLPKMSRCRRDFDETKYMYFLIKDD